MARPIWNGTISFGLLNIPVSLMPGEKKNDLHLRMMDARDNQPIRYERVNSETGEEVPWKDVVKAFEYDKGSYVVLDEEDIKSAAPDSHETVELRAFVDATSIGPQYFEKPYVLVPGKKSEKGYVLLRDVLADSGRVGIAKVVIRTREYLAAVMPQGDALLLLLMRYPQELVDIGGYELPSGKAKDAKLTPQEKKMAEQLVESMTMDWNPKDYKDEFRARLSDAIEKRLASKGAVKTKVDHESEREEGTATNVVYFMALLKKSLAEKGSKAGGKSTHAKKASGKPEKAPASSRRTRAKSSPAAKKAPAKAQRAAPRKKAAGAR